MNFAKTSLLLVLLLGTAACSSNMGTMSDGSRIEVVTVADGPDRSATLIRTETVQPGASAPVVAFNLETGQTTAGAVITAVAGTVPAAVTNGIFGLAIADRKGCGSGSNCGTVLNVQGAQAIAESVAEADSTTQATAIIAGATCGQSGLPQCAAIPMN